MTDSGSPLEQALQAVRHKAAKEEDQRRRWEQEDRELEAWWQSVVSDFVQRMAALGNPGLVRFRRIGDALAPVTAQDGPLTRRWLVEQLTDESVEGWEIQAVVEDSEGITVTPGLAVLTDGTTAAFHNPGLKCEYDTAWDRRGNQVPAYEPTPPGWTGWTTTSRILYAPPGTAPTAEYLRAWFGLRPDGSITLSPPGISTTLGRGLELLAKTLDKYV